MLHLPDTQKKKKRGATLAVNAAVEPSQWRCTVYTTAVTMSAVYKVRVCYRQTVKLVVCQTGRPVGSITCVVVPI